MKKIVGTLVIVVMLVAVLCVSTGCSMSGNNNQQSYDDSALLAELENLKDRVDELESKNNVFWTDKAEYGEHETMTVYFKDTAVFEVSLDFSSRYNTPFFDAGDQKTLNGMVFVKSLLADINAETVLSTAYLISDVTTCARLSYDGITLLNKDEKICVIRQYKSTVELSENESYDFVICVPGTPVELARFVDISVHILT